MPNSTSEVDAKLTILDLRGCQYRIHKTPHKGWYMQVHLTDSDFGTHFEYDSLEECVDLAFEFFMGSLDGKS